MALQLLGRALCARPAAGIVAVAAAAARRLSPVAIAQRWTHNDQVMDRIGKREIVGYGWNGSPCYYDRVDYPFPAVRFQEPSPEICALREKELCDWKKLTIDEKKALYRYSFCQTFSEFKAPTSDWKFSIGLGLLLASIGVFMDISYYYFLYPDDMLPDTFEEDRRKAQLKRIIGLEINPITGVASKWDYDRHRWK